ncbi:hypothetical protein ENBRE01_0962 [Enteropsectra breve]|nr:hypothetical protein ENBRE01_0962 [Enteropsectra breve]
MNFNNDCLTKDSLNSLFQGLKYKKRLITFISHVSNNDEQHLSNNRISWLKFAATHYFLLNIETSNYLLHIYYYDKKLYHILKYFYWCRPCKTVLNGRIRFYRYLTQKMNKLQNLMVYYYRKILRKYLFKWLNF